MSRARTFDAVRRVEDMLVQEGEPVALYICRMLIIQIASTLEPVRSSFDAGAFDLRADLSSRLSETPCRVCAMRTYGVDLWQTG